MIARILLMAALLLPALQAQLPRGFYPWWDRPVVKDLNLSPVQLKQIRLTVRDYRARLLECRAALAKAEADLQTIFDEETLDQTRANAAVDSLARARENLTRSLAEMSLKLRLQLTQQQWKELQKRREERRAEK